MKWVLILAAVGEAATGLALLRRRSSAVSPWTAPIVAAMVVAIVKVTGKNGYWITAEGYEYSLAIIAVAVGVALTGPGAYALDKLIG